MKIEIYKTKRVKEVIDVVFPHYYKHDLTNYEYENTSVVYGRITENEEVTIHENIKANGFINYKIEKDKRSDSYFDYKHKSTKEEYEAAKIRLNEFLNVL